MKVTALILASALAAPTAYALAMDAQDPAHEQERQQDKKRESGDLLPAVKIVEGKVESYTPGKSITVVKRDGTSATFSIPDRLVVTDNLVKGTKVTIRTQVDDATKVDTITVMQK